ncbi:MAG: hypothetical protein WCI73_05550 [Phycisphaerae bacterium]
MQAVTPDVVQHQTPHSAESARLRGLDLNVIGAQLVSLAEACTQEHLEMLSRSQADGLLALVRQQQGLGTGN